MSGAQNGLVRVLIADDHVPTRMDVRRALEDDARFEVCAEAADAAEAIQAALRERPDICLLDLRMPGDGLATVWEIRARLPEAKIVILTVSDEDADLFAAVESGADGYLLKTMNLGRLPEALNGVCSGEAAIPRTLVARILRRFRHGEPRWRQPVGARSARWRLTSREWEVLELLAEGCSTAEIAERLVLSSSAVRVHIASVIRKLGVPNRAAAVELFRRCSGHLSRDPARRRRALRNLSARTLPRLLPSARHGLKHGSATTARPTAIGEGNPGGAATACPSVAAPAKGDERDERDEGCPGCGTPSGAGAAGAGAAGAGAAGAGKDYRRRAPSRETAPLAPLRPAPVFQASSHRGLPGHPGEHRAHAPVGRLTAPRRRWAAYRLGTGSPAPDDEEQGEQTPNGWERSGNVR